ncbi:NADH:flavin oxidoreductase/NADH oxidase [Pseudooceanicola sp. CBS1P-1]|uniref:Oxidoreductase n=1 Tax=Pseudooceanicola albus TaxID=2692189 RepID=A0A6L7GA19_9RHOB|nr:MULTISPECIES: oxidoreductase [Pseudooceanicola]MBT9385976.1 NADH:flavin oxidoreductase/NADH oxidase [Pseudooceanicola endophyticus]MXN19603.1 oxidoreductase [Pseudooceanicola albus]
MSRAPAGLFTPLRIRGLEFANRLVLSPMCQYAARDGLAGDWHVDHYAHMAMSGLGAAVVEATAILPEGRITPACLGLWDEAHVPGLARIVAALHRHGARAGIQLGHAGRKGACAAPWDGGAPLPAGQADRWQPVAPSALPHAPGWPVPRALGLADLAALRAAYVAAARRAIAAGFDFIELHGAHGYLLHSFLSPLSNRREDGYGACPEARMRLPLEVARGLRAAMPDAMPLFYRASCIDRVAGGLTLEDTLRLAEGLKEAGVDLIDCSAGGIAPGTNGAALGAALTGQHGMAARLRAETGLATMAVGGIHAPRQALDLIAQGQADLVAVGTEMLRAFDFPRRCAEAAGLDDPDAVQPLRYAFHNRAARG